MWGWGLSPGLLRLGVNKSEEVLPPFMFTPHPAHLAPTPLPASPLWLAGPLTLCSGSQREDLSAPPSSAASKPWRISA